MINRLFALYFLFLSLYGLYSYTQVDPNLILSARPWLWQLQQQAWNLGYHHRYWAGLIFLLIIIGLTIIYGLILHQIQTIRFSSKSTIRWITTCVVVMLLAYPALSHDIFNYLFNAKMLWYYRADPHVQVAQDFPQDPWFTFTHNVHTPAPYYYGWTILSLIPSFLGQNHLKITLFLFRLFMIAGYFVWLAGLRRLGGHRRLLIALAINPLVLIEVIGNLHNDVWMMGLLIWSLVFARQAQTGKRYLWLLSLGLFLASVSIKFASVMVIIGLLLHVLHRLWRQQSRLGESLAIAHFLPLLTARSKWFLPWYLIWPLTFLPLSRHRLLNQTLILFSITGLLSYLPYLITGTYTASLLYLRSFILFGPPLCFVITQLILGHVINRRHLHEPVS